MIINIYNYPPSKVRIFGPTWSRVHEIAGEGRSQVASLRVVRVAVVGLSVGDGPSLAHFASDGRKVRHVATQVIRYGLVLHRVDPGPGNRTATVGRNLIPVLTGCNSSQNERKQEQQRKKQKPGEKVRSALGLVLSQMER